MEYLIGFVLALGVLSLARVTGLDRDRAFYVAVVMTIASYYVLFAVLGGSMHTLLVESAVMSAFVLVVLIGFKSNYWLVAASLAGHGVFDAFPDARGRRAHLTGKIPQRLALHGLPWLEGLPHLSFADVLADKGSAPWSRI